MSLEHKTFAVVSVTQTETEILPQNFNRILLYLRNRGVESIYMGSKASFDIDTESIEIPAGNYQSWTNDSCPANAIFVKCKIGLTSSLEVEEA